MAAAYVAMGLLPAGRAAHTYLPSHFASRHRRRLPLQGGASLTKEILVLEFDPLTLNLSLSLSRTRSLTLTL